MGWVALCGATRRRRRIDTGEPGVRNWGEQMGGKVSAENPKTMKELQQVVVIHRNHCATSKEGYVVKFSGPQLTDPGLERVAKAVRAALRKEGYLTAK